MMWSSRATISVASGPTFSGWPLRILIAGLIGMIGAAIFLQTAVHDEEENEDPLAMVSNWASEPTNDDEIEEDEDLWGMFTEDEEEDESKDVDQIDEEETQPKDSFEESEDEMKPEQVRENPEEETEGDVIDELRQRLGRRSKTDESADRLEALERRMQSRKNEE